MPLTDREILETFVECVDEMLDSQYLQQFKTGGVGTSISFKQVFGTVMDRTGPDRDSLKAVLLTIRLFRQNGDETSFQNIETLILGLPVNQDLKDCFSISRKNFNDHLQRAPSVGFPAGIGADTNDDIFDTFLYGKFAHFNANKWKRYKNWKTQPYFNDMCAQFDLTVLNFISCASVMEKIAKDILSSGAV